jgi:hypothetical protein
MQIFKYRGILTLTDTTLMFVFLQRFLPESRGFAFFLMFRVNDPVFEKRGIPARVHENFYRLFVVLAFCQQAGARDHHEADCFSVLFRFT